MNLIEYLCDKLKWKVKDRNLAVININKLKITLKEKWSEICEETHKR